MLPDACVNPLSPGMIRGVVYAGAGSLAVAAGRRRTITLLLEILLSIFLHPIAMVLCWVNIAQRRDLSPFKKFIWLLVTIIWGLGPILYVLFSDGSML